MRTFKQSYDLIVNAYLKNKLNPWDPCACFVGNLLNGYGAWGSLCLFYDDTGEKSYTEGIMKESENFYTFKDVRRLENMFLFGKDSYNYNYTSNYNRDQVDKNNEQSLYEAMERTLLLLKQIHESKGEVVENYVFTKRKLEPETV